MLYMIQTGVLLGMWTSRITVLNQDIIMNFLYQETQLLGMAQVSRIIHIQQFLLDGIYSHQE